MHLLQEGFSLVFKTSYTATLGLSVLQYHFHCLSCPLSKIKYHFTYFSLSRSCSDGYSERESASRLLLLSPPCQIQGMWRSIFIFFLNNTTTPFHLGLAVFSSSPVSTVLKSFKCWKCVWITREKKKCLRRVRKVLFFCLLHRVQVAVLWKSCQHKTAFAIHFTFVSWRSERSVKLFS